MEDRLTRTMNIGKKKMIDLRERHNRLVKDDYKVGSKAQVFFNNWFVENCTIGEDHGADYEGAPFFTYIELTSDETKSGHAEILEVA